MKNPWHRRSKTAGDKIWLDHRLVTAIDLGIVMQPCMKKRKSVTDLTDIECITNPKISKKCFMTEEQDSNGELETHLHKMTGLVRIQLFVHRTKNGMLKA